MARIMPAEAVAQTEVYQYELACDQAIATCNGDARSAVKALLIANEFLEREMQDLKSKVSHGYLRMEPMPAPADRKDWYD